MVLFFIFQELLELKDSLSQPPCLDSILVVFLNLADYLSSPVKLPTDYSHSSRNIRNMRDIDIFSVGNPFFKLLYPHVPIIQLFLVLSDKDFYLAFQLLSLLCLLFQLLEKVAFHLGGVFVHVVRFMGLFVIFSDVVDDLHVLIVQHLQGLSLGNVYSEDLAQHQTDVFSALGQSQEKGGVETVFFTDFGRLPDGHLVNFILQDGQLRQSLFAFLKYGHDELFDGPLIVLHLSNVYLQLFRNINFRNQSNPMQNVIVSHHKCENIIISQQIMKKEEDNHDSEFQRVEPDIKVEKKYGRSRVSIQHGEEEDEPKQEEDLKQSRKAWDFLQANPILPPDRHRYRQEPRLRLSYANPNNKFARTSFAGTSAIKGMHKTHQKHGSFSIQKDQSQATMSPQQQADEVSDCNQLKAILEKGVQVYRRINNSKINSLGKEKQRVVCSVFFDWRSDKIKSTRQPIFEHLASIAKTKRPISQPHWLQFDSSFQSGNLLLSVFRPNEAFPTFQLYMQNDINTKGCTQWYYFSVVSRSKGKVKFRIMNFYKPTSLYQKGMKVLCSNDRLQWRRTGTSITYGKETAFNGYSLEFIHQFDTIGKATYFCYGYPYTYTHHLTDFVTSLTNQVKYAKILQKTTLCLSAMGNPIPLLWISNFLNKKEPKPLIYIIARQHPGQTPASFIVEGVINFLLSSTLEAKQLRDKYEFKVVPMMNVDGVISGNYRSNLSGSDINRQWQFPSKRGQPEVYWLKQEISSNKKQTAFFLDIHAHSRKMGSFFYGSKAASRDNKLYPFICSKLNKFVSYAQSSFTDDPSKKTTARVILQTQLQIPRSLTFESSFYGWVDPAKGSIHSFKPNDLKAIGQSLAIALYYSFIGIQKVKKTDQSKNSILPKCQSEKQKTLYKNSAKMLEKWIKQQQKQAAEEGEQVFSEGSSLDPEHFQLKQEEIDFIAEMDKLQLEKRQNHKKDILKRNLSSPKKKQQDTGRRVMIFQSLNLDNESKLLTPKKDTLNQESLGISSSQFYHISHSVKKQNKKLFSVRQLQLQLQLEQELSPENKKLRGMRLKMQNDSHALDRYESLDINRTKNYKEDVWQMKRALKYLLQSKNTNYDSYRPFFKSITNDHMNDFSTTCVKRDKRYNL